MSTPRPTLALILVFAAAALTGCGGSQQAANPSTPPVSSNAPIGGIESSPASSSAAASAAGATSSASAAADPAQLGKQIFTTGNGSAGSPVPTSSGLGGPCAHCHGDDAKGKVGPDIRWGVLTGSAASSRAPRFKLSSEAQFAKAVAIGDAAGNQLRGMMPHYQLTDAQAAALVAYLKTL